MVDAATRKRKGERENSDPLDGIVEHHTDPGSRWLYFISTEDDGPIKIGMANSPWSRLLEFQCGHWEQLCIIGALDCLERGGARGLEAQLHHMFARDRIRGEWFKRTEELICTIESLCEGNSFTGNPITTRDAGRWLAESP